jgi:hypothetical protein
MTRLADVLFEYLSNDGPIAALVDNGTDPIRIFPMRLPEKCIIPAISWQRIDAECLYTYEAFEDTTAWVRARVQFNCWGHSYDDADQLGDAVLLALSGYDNEFIGSTWAVNEFDTYEPTSKLFRRIVDFRISYEDDLVTAS